MSFCKICKADLSSDPESLHYNCGGDCRWCMAQAGDPDCQARVFELMLQGCLEGMTDTFKGFVQRVKEVDGDPDLFAMRVLESWRPW